MMRELIKTGFEQFNMSLSQAEMFRFISAQRHA